VDNEIQSQGEDEIDSQAYASESEGQMCGHNYGTFNEEDIDEYIHEH